MVENRLGRLFTRVFNVPLFIQPEKFMEIIAALEGSDQDFVKVFGVKRTGDTGKPADTGLEFPESVHVIPVHGTLVSRTHGLDALSGLTSYESIRKEFQAAINGPASMVLFDIMSSGGEGDGNFDLVDEIFEARGKKPIIAMANHRAFSAAYSIASAADEVWLTRTGGVGSIGVIMVHMDRSEFDKKEGFKWTLTHAGAKKVDGNPYEPLSESAKAKFKEIVTDGYEVFTQIVARNRGMEIGAVKGTEAECFFGQKAVKAGLADKIVTFSSAVEMTTAMVDTKKSITMAIPSESHQEPGSGEYPHLNAHDQSTGMGDEKEKKGGAVKMTKEELKAQFPDLYQEVFEEGKTAATTELTKAFDAEKAQWKNENSELQTRVLDLEKRDIIRTEAEISANAERIWDAVLGDSDISPDLHGKVKQHVSHKKYMKEGVLDTAAFTKAVEDEVADWEGRMKAQGIKGFGSSGRDVGDSNSIEEQRLEAEDDAGAEEMLRLSGDADAAQKFKKGGE